MRILSLGWGVQSFTLAAMAALGEIEPVDFAVHADTTHESALTYQYADKWRGWLEVRGVKVVTVINHNSELGENRVVDIPAYTRSISSDGQIRRQCTVDWKINPIRKYISGILDERGLKKSPGVVKQLIGISWDEIQRMKPSDVKYIKNEWPLIDKRMTRNSCKKWLETHGLEIPPRSACVFCPFKSTAEWRATKANETDWSEAVSVDNMIRHARPPHDLFIHPSRKPIDEVDFRTEVEKGQLELWDSECSGICGI